MALYGNSLFVWYIAYAQEHGETGAAEQTGSQNRGGVPRQQQQPYQTCLQVRQDWDDM